MNSSSSELSVAGIAVDDQPAIDPDAALAAAAKAGNHAAYEQLVHRHHQRLIGFLRPRLDSLADAEDVAQQTFLKAWRNLHRFDTSYRFSAWLYTIAARLAVSLHRKRKYHPLPELDRRPAEECSPGIGSDARSLLWTVARDGLSDSQFQALWLFYRGELSVRETATVMSKTQVHVKVLLFRGRNALAKLLRERGLEENFRGTA